MDDLVNRLRRVEPRQIPDGCWAPFPVNPDGPEAANEIERLTARLASYEVSRKEDNDRVSRRAREAGESVFRGEVR